MSRNLVDHRTKGIFMNIKLFMLTPRLSYKAIGLYAHISQLCQTNENWSFSVAGLAAIAGEGKDSIISGLKELEAAKLLVREQTRDATGKLGDSIWHLHDLPTTEEPPTAEPATEKPFTENPPTAEPLTVNPLQRKKDLKESSNQRKKEEGRATGEAQQGAQLPLLQQDPSLGPKAPCRSPEVPHVPSRVILRAECLALIPPELASHQEEIIDFFFHHRKAGGKLTELAFKLLVGQTLLVFKDGGDAGVTATIEAGKEAKVLGGGWLSIKYEYWETIKAKQKKSLGQGTKSYTLNDRPGPKLRKFVKPV
jgi:hypothetical protein